MCISIQTDIHQLFEKNHRLLKSQITRFYRICSEFEQAWSILYGALSKQNYSKRWMRRITFKPVLELKYKILNTELTKPNQCPSKAGSFKCGKSQCKTCKIIVDAKIVLAMRQKTHFLSLLKLTENQKICILVTFVKFNI